MPERLPVHIDNRARSGWGLARAALGAVAIVALWLVALAGPAMAHEEGVVSAPNGGGDGTGTASAVPAPSAAPIAMAADPGTTAAPAVEITTVRSLAGLDQTSDLSGGLSGGLSSLVPFVDLFGPPGSQARLVPVAIVTSATTTLLLAFLFFGRRRREEELPASDADLAAAAGRPYTVIPATLVPAFAGVDPGTGGTDVDLPRWRRPSLLAARASNPAVGAGLPRQRLFFDPEDTPSGQRERLYVRYRIVKLLDQPDELLGNTVAQLDAGDEVEVLGTRGTYRRVLTPDGSAGWVHRMVLAGKGDSERDGRTEGDGPDLLSAYLAARSRR